MLSQNQIPNEPIFPPTFQPTDFACLGSSAQIDNRTRFTLDGSEEFTCSATESLNDAADVWAIDESCPEQ